MQSPDEIQVQSLSVLKKVALLIGLACCVSRPGACSGLWTGQMLLVCSTNVSVMCMYCFVGFAEEAESHQIVREKAPKKECVIHNRALVITDE